MAVCGSRLRVGFKLQLIVDADYDMPIDYKVTRASAWDIAVGREMITDIGLNSAPNCDH